MPHIDVKAPIAVIMIEKDGRKQPYIARDARHNRLYWPIFTDRIKATHYMAGFDDAIRKRLHLVVLGNVKDFVLRFAPFVEFFDAYCGAQGAPSFACIDHPGPSVTATAFHVEVRSLFKALSAANIARIEDDSA